MLRDISTPRTRAERLRATRREETAILYDKSFQRRRDKFNSNISHNQSIIIAENKTSLSFNPSEYLKKNKITETSSSSLSQEKEEKQNEKENMKYHSDILIITDENEDSNDYSKISESQFPITSQTDSNSYENSLFTTTRIYNNNNNNNNNKPLRVLTSHWSNSHNNNNNLLLLLQPRRDWCNYGTPTSHKVKKTKEIISTSNSPMTTIGNIFKNEEKEIKLQSPEIFHSTNSFSSSSPSIVAPSYSTISGKLNSNIKSLKPTKQERLHSSSLISASMISRNMITPKSKSNQMKSIESNNSDKSFINNRHIFSKCKNSTKPQSGNGVLLISTGEYQRIQQIVGTL